MRGLYAVPIYNYPLEGEVNYRYRERDKNYARRWHGIVAICKSLARDKLDYRIMLEKGWDSDGDMHVQLVVRAWGTPAKRKTRPVLTARSVPERLTLEQCMRRLGDAEESLAGWHRRVPEWMKENTTDGAYYAQPSPELRLLHKKVGGTIAKIIRRRGTATPLKFEREDYEELDRAVGHRVLRESELDTRAKDMGYLRAVVKHYAQSWNTGNMGNGRRRVPEPPEPSLREDLTPIQEFLTAKMDVEHWGEMVRLSNIQNPCTPSGRENGQL